MTARAGNIILVGMIVGAIAGAFGGYYLSDLFVRLDFLGTMFLNALNMIVVPLIVASMVVGVTSLGDVRKLGRTTGKTFVYYMITTGFSVFVGLVMVNLIRPGVGIEFFGGEVPEQVADATGKTLVDVVTGLIPRNIFAAAAAGDILPLIIFSLLFGGVLTAIGEKGKPVIGFFEGVNVAIMKLVVLVIYFAPVGVMAIIGGIVAERREMLGELVTGLGWYITTVLLGLLVHAFITLPLILRFFGRKRPVPYALNMGQALATAFTTASSSATLPITMELAEGKNKIDRRASSFVLPLGATINMDGTAMYEAVAAIFISQIYGIDLGLGQQVVIFLTAVLASVGASGIPHAGTVMMVLVLTAVGLPLEGIGLIWAVDWFLDRCRTTVNVWGDSVGAAVIGETVEIRGSLDIDRAAED
jgi:Na+/H+-dicarboxylate symporter